MPQEKDTGIVLSKISSGEADDICSIYTKNSGKDKFIFRGLKKSKKRPRTASEPGSVINFVYYSGKNGKFNTISEFDIPATFSTIRQSTVKIFSLFFMLELVDLTTGLSDPNIKIFNLLSAGIDNLSKTDYPLHSTVFFTVKYLLLQGILPDTGTCLWCGNDDHDKLIIEDAGLKTSCINCSDYQSAALNNRETEFVNKCVNLKLDKIDCIQYNEKNINSILAVLINYVNSYYSINLKSGYIIIK